jgi:hypothetical protein
MVMTYDFVYIAKLKSQETKKKKKQQQQQHWNACPQKLKAPLSLPFPNLKN